MKKKVENIKKEKESLLSGLAKKVLLTGLGAISMTEESIRNVLGDVKLPKEAMGFVFEQAKKQKEDLITAVAHEVSNFLSKVKLHEEIQKALASLQLHVEAKVSFGPKGKAHPEKIKIEVEEA